MILPSRGESRLRELAQPDLGALLTTAMSFTRSGVPFLRVDHRLFDVVNVLEQTDFADIHLLHPSSMKLPPRIGIVVGKLLLHLADVQSIGDQLVRIDAHLVFARRAAESWRHPPHWEPT